MLFHRYLLLLCLLCVPLAQAQFSGDEPGGSSLFEGSSGQADFLPVHEAFRPSVEQRAPDLLRVRFDMPPGYYLYRHRLGFEVPGAADAIKAIRLPAGQPKTDEYFGEVEVYYNSLDVDLELAADASVETLRLTFQGCADAGLCYPPETVTIGIGDGSTSTAATAQPSETSGAAEGTGLALLLFFLAGLGLTFTPCVLPMLPILSSLVLGRQHIDRPRALVLSTSYVLGMAITFAAVGALIGVFGAALNIQARMQSPWLLGVFAVLFALFALAMFGLFDLRLPAALREPLERLGSRTRGGSIPGAALMGALSTLVVSPCISAPLAGALVYISATGDALGGALRLFSLALGMGIPLLLVAVFGNALLPRSGPWLNSVKQLFGFGLLGVAIWLLERILPGSLSLALWSALFAGLAVQLGLFERAPRSGWGRFSQALALLAAFYSLAALAGALAGGHDPLRPLQPFADGGTPSAAVGSEFFTTVESRSELEQELARAEQAGRPAVLELYADWCISCKIIERRVLGDPQVQARLQDVARIRLDLTDNTADQRAWLTDNQLFGPPVFLFYADDGSEVPALRLPGEIDSADMLSRLDSLSGQ
ncbi:protein-disulfide reductase DsbD [Halopseudomonas nanhaiensis]|uniref:protein-disulfide reductase DsbD n=1 Tax=Halopseudomonas nanhaiensis TaxID=2830842 RepID=UPI001CBB2697|nr:protein-disulfide reductase DsbD [Halopseudomonas nanhaiensis]UAW99154.1 protein-disulfide reductase DsbD [Halopseudomonas nanhaiensis]